MKKEESTLSKPLSKDTQEMIDWLQENGQAPWEDGDWYFNDFSGMPEES